MTAARRRSVLALALLALALLATGILLTACGAEDNGGVIVGDPDDPVTAPPASDDTLPPGDGPARLVEPTPGLDDVTVTVIQSIVVVDDTTLEVRFHNGVEPCYGVDHVDVEDTPTAVIVEVGVGRRPDAGGVACIEIAELQGVRITLRAPLGDRAVVDRATGRPVPVS